MQEESCWRAQSEKNLAKSWVETFFKLASDYLAKSQVATLFKLSSNDLVKIDGRCEK